jgi:hypothetical protein
MEYAVACRCGNRIEVRAAQAGSQVQCPCGQIVAVPALSQLRYVAGQPRYEIHIVDKVRQMVSDGRLPIAQSCIECGRSTQSISTFIVECQRPWTRGNSYWKTIVLTLTATLLAPFWMALAIFQEVRDADRNPEIIGTELIVQAPIRLCSECSSKLGSRQRELQRLLRKEPAYDELLQEYPTSRIHAQRP